MPVKVVWEDFFHTEQRIVPTGLAARDNEVKQRRDLSESIFREWLPADAVRDGAIHDWAMTKAQRGGASPVYVTRFGEPREWISDLFRLPEVMWRMVPHYPLIQGSPLWRKGRAFLYEGITLSCQRNLAVFIGRKQNDVRRIQKNA